MQLNVKYALGCLFVTSTKRGVNRSRNKVTSLGTGTAETASDDEGLLSRYK